MSDELRTSDFPAAKAAHEAAWAKAKEYKEMMGDEHKPGCPALGGYGNGVEACSCGADELPRKVTPQEDAVLRAAARRSAKIIARGRMSHDLPKLPPLASSGIKNPYTGVSLYEREAVREYGRQCDAAAVARERERCAKVADGYIGCDGLAAVIRGGD